MKHGDFTQLAEQYVAYRPAYSPLVADAFLGLCAKNKSDSLKGVDIGAGTGIWTKMLADRNAHMLAIEPNDAMREKGAEFLPTVEWYKGSGEETGLEAHSCDFVSMASSFHWPDYDKAIAEFARILKTNGYFIALWNPRRIESNPLLVDIENKLYELHPSMQRKSSGRSEFCEGLTERLMRTECIKDVLYIEGRHTELQSKERYLGLWKSVNDIPVQLGEKKFAEFLSYIDNKIDNNTTIEAEYSTRAWIAQFK